MFFRSLLEKVIEIIPAHKLMVFYFVSVWGEVIELQLGKQNVVQLVLAELVVRGRLVQDSSPAVDVEQVQRDSHFKLCPSNGSPPHANEVLRGFEFVFFMLWVRAACVSPHIGECDLLG